MNTRNITAVFAFAVASFASNAASTFSYDAFLSVTTNSDYTVMRDGVVYGYITNSLSSTVTCGASSSVTALASGVFAGNTTITTVNLSSCTGLTAIPSDCFAGCTALTTVTLPSSCVNIGPGAFAGCTALASFTGNGVAAVSHDAFNGCTALTAASSLPDAIGAYAYANTATTAANLSGVTTVNAGAFANCSSLTSTSNLPTTLPDALFSGDAALSTADLSDVTTFGVAALAGCDALTTMTLADSPEFGEYALAAGTATIATTLGNSKVPDYDSDTVFLGRAVSYTLTDGSVVRIEASELVEWLQEQAKDESSEVTQPTDSTTGSTSYATAALESWLSDSSNEAAILAFCYGDDSEDEVEATDVLTVSGTEFTFIDSDKTAVKVTPVASYDLADGDDGFSEDNVTLAETETDGVYTATPSEEDADACFMRLKFSKGW